jgi:recombination protein RecA
MAKKKKDDEAVTIDPSNIENSIIKDFGDVVFDYDQLKTMRKVVIPVSPALNIGLNGGIPEGTWTTLTGREKIGKTVTALQIAANAQDPKYANELCPDGRLVVYLSVEGRIKQRDIDGIPNLDKSRFKFVQSTAGNILNAEKYLSIAEKYITNVPGCVVIIDSYSALSTDAEMSGGMADQQRADGAKLLAKFCRKMANIVPINRNIIIGITHLMSNPSGMGAESSEKSGRAIAYQADNKLHGKWAEAWNLGDKQIGLIIHWDIKFSSLGAPGPKVDSYFRFNHGLDRFQELAVIGSDLGLIAKSGSWFSIDIVDGEEKPKVQGIEKVRNYLAEHIDIADKLEKEIYDIVGIKINESV